MHTRIHVIVREGEAGARCDMRHGNVSRRGLPSRVEDIADPRHEREEAGVGVETEAEKKGHGG